MMHRAKYLALALATTGALSGCGGGGGGGEAAAAAFDEFYGSWKLPSRVCGKATTAWSNNAYFTNGADVVTLTANGGDSKTIYFSDNTCTTKAGAVIEKGTLQWSQGSVAGRSNVARLANTKTGFTASRDGDGTGITLNSLPATGQVEKFLLDVVDGKLCVGSDTNTADSEGYPTVIDSTNCWSR